MNKVQTYVFFGIVGSGKGTQVELLEKYLKENNISKDILSTSTGSEFRKLIERNNYSSELVKIRLEKGELQPDFLTISLLVNILATSLEKETTFIADGFPRTIGQAEAFESAMKFYDREDIHVIYIELSKEEAIKRMKLRGRSDDTDKGIAERFEVYTRDVIPSMDYFSDKSGYIMHVINGNQSIEEVQAEIIKSLNLK